MPGLFLGYGLWGLYQGPALYAYSEFVGYFAGPLYDLADYRLETLLTYRLGSLLLAAALILATPLVRGALPMGAPQLERRRSVNRTARLVALVLAGSYVTYRGLGPSLGHELNEARLAELLPAKLNGQRCHVRYQPSQTSKKSAQLVLRQCEADLVSVAGYFEVQQPARLTVSLFASQEEKGRITGAGRTSVAKPWRGEVHVQEAGFPHPVLRHEIAHIVAAEFGAGPFRVAGPLGGLVPDPGRIEGFAVAAAPAWASDGTLEDWAAAQDRVGKMPPLSSLFQLSFYGSSSVAAYGSAGAFVAFVKDVYGASVLKRWYQGEALELLTGVSLSALERTFKERLAQLEVPLFVLRAAEERYAALAVGERRCPHAVDRALGRAQALCELDPGLARREVERATALDPSELDSNLWLSSCFAAAGELGTSRELLEKYRTGPSWSLREKELALADLLNESGNVEQAKRRYEALLGTATSSAEVRALELRLWALSDHANPVSKELVRIALVQRRTERERLAQLAVTASSAPSGFLGGYLLGRALFREGAWESAQASFAFALAAEGVLGANGPSFQEPPFVELKTEALRLLLTSSCARGDRNRFHEVEPLYSARALTKNQHVELTELRGICP